MNNNIKIVYKKPTQYDNNSNSTLDLDESVLSIDLGEINQNTNKILRNNIFKEINNDIISTSNYLNSNLNSNSSVDTNNINNNDQNLDENNKDETFFYNIFIKYIKNNNIDFLSLTNKEIFTNTIKKFIYENKLNQEQIFHFLNLIKNKINEQDEKNKINEQDEKNKFNEQDEKNKFNEQDEKNKFNEQDEKNKFNEQDEKNNFENFQNLIQNEEYTNSMLVDLAKNDINTWIFLCVILISFIIIIMIIIYKK
jgi:hypothetical protein